jgi:3-hydroxyisobutyrate dehydrogenase-like beta-hydroxyacid dehydrogenase
MNKKIGFIGVGEMGFPMARNLLKAGYDCYIFDLDEKSLRALKKQGAHILSSPKQVAEISQTLIVMVRTTEQAMEVTTGKDGVLSGATPGLTILLTSTIDPLAAQEISKVASEKGVALLDCPVSGARQGAETGTLTIMVGGAKNVFQDSLPVLRVLGQNIFYVGESGMGEIVKLINNMIHLVSMNAVFEAMNLAKKTGVNLETLIEVIKVSSGNNWVIENWEIVSNWKKNYVPGGTLDLSYKDMGLTLALAESQRVSLPLAGLVKQLGRY